MNAKTWMAALILLASCGGATEGTTSSVASVVSVSGDGMTMAEWEAIPVEDLPVLEASGTWLASR